MFLLYTFSHTSLAFSNAVWDTSAFVCRNPETLKTVPSLGGFAALDAVCLDYRDKGLQITGGVMRNLL